MDFPDFKNNRLRLGLDILILALSLYGVSKWSGKYEKVSPVKSFFMTNFAAAQQGVTSVNNKFSDLFNNYLANIEASKENKALKNKIANLENQIFSFEELAKENKRLKELLQFGKKQAERPILSQIVGWNSSSDFKVLRINKGFKDGIRLQSPVVTSKGLVGYIYRLTDHFADVLTILDANNKVDAIWRDTNAKEMRAFIGMNIYMGIFPSPNVRMYWSKDVFVGNKGFSDVMTCNRYGKLNSYFHVSDRETEPQRGSPNYDRLFKVVRFF